ncbi:MAG: polysaccharide biosynthesis/export family protein [Flavobacteriales bacterium]
MTRTIRRILLPALVGVILFTGCTVNKDIMFKTPTDYKFDVVGDSTAKTLRIQPNDVIQFRLFANDGFKMIDLVSEGGLRDAGFQNRNVFTYYVEYDGVAKLPLLGRIPIAGYTLRDAERMLEEKYTQYYNHPYVQLLVTNRRVVVFPGGGGDAKVVPLEQNNTTLLEVLAHAGGLNKRGNAEKVKVFRLDPSGKRKVFEFDLSDISGLQYADLVMQGDDVVYVQPNAQLATEVLQDLVPVITLVTTILLAISVVRSFQQ